MKFELALLAEIAQCFKPRAVGRGIQLGGDNNHRFFDERSAKCLELAVNDRERVDRIIRIRIARINQMDEQARAFDVAKKTNAEARAQMRAFDEDGKIGDYKCAA